MLLLNSMLSDFIAISLTAVENTDGSESYRMEFLREITLTVNISIENLSLMQVFSIALLNEK